MPSLPSYLSLLMYFLARLNKSCALAMILYSHWLLLTKRAAVSVSGELLHGAWESLMETFRLFMPVGLFCEGTVEPLVRAVFAFHKGQHIIKLSNNVCQPLGLKPPWSHRLDLLQKLWMNERKYLGTDLS